MAHILATIRKALATSGVTRYAISQATGIDQGQLSRLMRGQSGLSIERLETLAKFLGLEITIRAKRKQGKTNGKHQ